MAPLSNGLLISRSAFASPGTQQFDAPGALSFVVPNFKTSLDIEFWGAGASGGPINPAGNNFGDAGGDTYCTALGLKAGGGQRIPNGSNGGEGGVATGGDTNTTGGRGGARIANNIGGNGGPGANGGAGGQGGQGNKQPGRDGQAPGGGGGGAGSNVNGTAGAQGGAGGAHLKKTYAKGQLKPGDIVSFVVGAGSFTPGLTIVPGRGANGRAKFTWR